jgi:predicted peptidase
VKGEGFALGLAWLADLFPWSANGQEAAVNPMASKLIPAELVAAAEFYEARSVHVAEGFAEDGNGRVEFRYRLLRPRPVESGRRYPVVLFLHGAGERGDDNMKQLKYLPAWMAESSALQRHPCFLIAPQCRMDERWVDISWADKKSVPQSRFPTADLAAAVAALDDVMRTESVDPDRVYLTGLSMGGYGTWDLATRMPERFAALLPICGGGDENTAGRVAKLPIWCFHGDADATVPVVRSQSMIEAVRAAGGSPEYAELPGVGHDSWTPAYRDPAVLDWLFSQRR